MSQINHSVTNETVIPILESSLFVVRPDARFAIGVLAVGSSIIPGRQEEYDAYFRLRRNVYVEQTQMLSHSNVLADGTERDQDDDRSIAFGVVENLGTKQRLVAAARLIQKDLGVPVGYEPEALPVEKEWPEAFVNRPAKSTAIEVSRLISRHERASTQELNKRKLYAATLSYVQAKNLGPVYAIVEDWFERDLKRFVPVSRIGGPKYLEHYNDTNVPIEVDVPELARRIEIANPDLLSETQSIGEMALYGTLRPSVVAA